jgi:hypothetical protein
MGGKFCAALAALALVWSSAAEGMPRIRDGKVVVTFDLGGYVHLYEAKWKYIASKGYPVEIRGPCLSACTLALGIIKNICWGKGAKFGFHLAFYWERNVNGKMVLVTDLEYTRKMGFEFYPHWVTRWVSATGGYTPQIRVMGPEVFGRYIKRCEG